MKKLIQKFKNASLKVKVALLVVVGILLIGTMGLSYAYFSAIISNGEGEIVTLTSGRLELTLADGENLIGSKLIKPGDVINKEFSVANTGTLDTTYNLFFSEVMNTFVTKSELVYTLTSNDGGANVAETEVPSDILKAVNGQAIIAGATHHYTLRIEYKNTDRDQQDNVDCVFGFRLSINEAKKVKVNTIYYLDNTEVVEMPDRYKDYKNTSSECDHGAVINFNQETWTYSIGNVNNRNTTCRLYFETLYKDIVFDKNAGADNDSVQLSESTRTIASGSQYGELPQPTRPGYTFNGWYTTPNKDEGEQVTSANILGKQSTIVYAAWNINTYTLTVNPNTGVWDGYTASQPYQIVFRGTKTINDPTKDGYHFTGWTGLDNGTTLDNGTLTMGYDNTEIVANYEKNTYNLVIELNNGQTSECPSSNPCRVLFGDTKTISDPTKEGNTFSGWSDTSVLAGTTYTQPSHDVTLTAQWTPKNYKWIVKHMQMSTDGTTYTEESATTGTGAYGTQFPTTDIRKNYTGFIKPNNGSDYVTKTIGVDVLAGATETPTNNVLEYRYAREQHTLTMNLDGGSYSGTNPVDVYYGQTVNLATPTKTCHTFAGWSGISGNSYTGGLENKTITATWTIDQKTITFNANGGSVDPGSSSVNCGGTLTLPTPTKDGYDFDGWFTDPTGGTQVTNSTVWTSSETIYAHWTPITAAYVTYSNSTYTTCTNVNCALNELYTKFS